MKSLLLICTFTGCILLVPAPVAIPACIIGCQTATAACAAACVASGIFIPACEAGCVVVYSGCIAGCGSALCFHPSTQIKTANDSNSQVLASDMVANTEIVSLSGANQEVQYDLAPIVTISTGDFEFVELAFTNQKHLLKVTLDHIMFKYGRDGELVLVEARDVAKGDRLPSIDCSMNGCKTKEIEVVTTNLFHDTTKVHIETLKGTIIANGILTSSICQGYDIGVETAVGDFYEDLLRNHTVKLSAANNEYKPESGECIIQIF